MLKVSVFIIGNILECYYCRYDEEGDCNADMDGIEVQCQMNNPEEHHYGDACYVGHSGNIIYTVQFKNIRVLHEIL